MRTKKVHWSRSLVRIQACELPLLVMLAALLGGCATTRALDRCDPYSTKTCVTQAHLTWLEENSR